VAKTTATKMNRNPKSSTLHTLLLSQLGVALPTEGHYVTKGTVRHSKKGKVSISKEAGNVTFSRSGLAQYLIEQSRQKYPDQIQYHFDSPCQGERILLMVFSYLWTRAAHCVHR
jgi:hypothetical protein